MEPQFDETHRFTVIPLPTPFPVGPVNVYLLEWEQCILVDTGLKSDESYELLMASLKRRGVSLRDLDAVIVTHGHRDHMGALGRILEESGAPAYAHPYVAKQGREGDASDARRDFYENILVEFGVPEDVRLQANSLYDQFRSFSDPFAIAHEVHEGETVLGFDVHFVPGHSPSDTLFVHRERGVTLLGDHVLQTTNPNPLLRRPEEGEARPRSLVEYRASLRKSRELPLGLCLPGHGAPFSDVVETIDRILERQDKRTEMVYNLVAAGAASPYAVSAALFPQLAIKHIHLGLSVAVGHMEVLEAEGRLIGYHRDGQLYFERAEEAKR